MSLFLSFFSRALSKSLSLTDDFSFSSAPLSFAMSLQSSFVFLFTRIIGVKPELQASSHSRQVIDLFESGTHRRSERLSREQMHGSAEPPPSMHHARSCQVQPGSSGPRCIGQFGPAAPEPSRASFGCPSDHQR